MQAVRGWVVGGLPAPHLQVHLAQVLPLPVPPLEPDPQPARPPPQVL